ncbi:hypothetical protein M5K25_022675 [Dendrobium thyrsiflorum]|uniref:Protein FAR1-RELATED SEQUENCE n=1 Tax=Dendrobium thyrsiflorum TaxID=117978 RepID=A0ABD0UCU5_DENTH
MEVASATPKNPRRARIARRDLNSQEISGDATMEESGHMDGMDEGDADADSGDDSGFEGVPEVGMVFKTHHEVSKFYKKYARRVGFGVSVRRSSFTKEGHCLYLELMCCKGGRKRPEPKFRKRTTATTNCPARIRVKLWGDGLLHLELASLDHNHPVSPSMARFLNCYKHLSGFSKKRAFRNDEGDVDEIEAIMYCHASLIKIEGTISTFDVKECIFLEDGKRTMNRNHGVLYNSEEKDVQCICGSFQFRGILCRHALSVFKLQQVHEIPSQYVLDRWKKDFKLLHVLNRSSDDVVANNRIDRYDYLSMRCLQLVEVGILSDKYQLALKLIREVEKFLLSDSTYEETQPKIVSRVNKPTKPDGINTKNLGNNIPLENGNEERRRRGRLPQVKDSEDGINHYAAQVSPQQFIGNQTALRPSVVYMFPVCDLIFVEVLIHKTLEMGP